MMKRWVQWASVCVVLLSGCGRFFIPQNSTGSGTGTGNTAAGDVLYFMNVNATTASSSTISAYTVSTTGVLTAASGSPYSPGFVPTSIAITPGNTFLYVGYTGGVIGYSIGTNGVLTLLNSGASLNATQPAPVSMQVDSTGTFLLAASEDLSTTLPEVGLYQINTSTGGLTLVSGYPLVLKQSGNGSTSATPANAPNQLYIAPNNAYVYLTLGSGGTEILNLSESTSTLTDTTYYVNLSSGGSGQVGVLSNSTSTVLYVTETNAGVRAFPIGTNGVTGTELSGSPFAAGTGPSALSFDKSGDYLYVTNKGDGTISGYSVAAAGGLTALSSSPFTAGSQPISLALDETGDFLAVANDGGSPNLGTYSFDATTGGKLDPVTNSVTTNAAGTSIVVGTQ